MATSMNAARLLSCRGRAVLASRRVKLAGLLGVVLSGSGCHREPKTQVERGAGVFARACASCHALGPGQKAALGFKVLPPDLRDPGVISKLKDEQIERVVREGKGQMPPFGKLLAPQEVSALLAYLRSPARDSPR